MLFFKKIFHDLNHDLKNLHSFSKNILAGTFPLVGTLLLFAAVIDRLALYTPDVHRSLRYSQAAWEAAPATLAAGIIAALLCDLILRGKTSGGGMKNAEKESRRENGKSKKKKK